MIAKPAAPPMTTRSTARRAFPPPIRALTQPVSARIGGGNARRAVLRVVIGGAAGLAITYGIGHLFGAAIG